MIVRSVAPRSLLQPQPPPPGTWTNPRVSIVSGIAVCNLTPVRGAAGQPRSRSFIDLQV
ncbi:unnamed protein product [Pleuronectes platessa]|uniref:Uncharacterized protein n=1 Tax=Pleuronectes platessa TaxID=8262 RepID=A0A9N7YI68_PLEPL|nr:unnamed protein product [Pleuronectes platessa]